MRLLCLILFSLFSLYGCDEKYEEGCGEVNCTVSAGSQAVNIHYTTSHTVALGDYSIISPEAFETYDNNFSCTLPQELIDAGFSISPNCDIYGVPLKTISGLFTITILDFDLAIDKSVLVQINVTGGLGCNGFGNEVTIVNFPAIWSPTFSFCVENNEYIGAKAGDLGIVLPINGCQGACTESLSLLVSGSVDQSAQTALTVAQDAASYVLYDVAYPTSDVTLNLFTPLTPFCLLDLVPCVP